MPEGVEGPAKIDITALRAEAQRRSEADKQAFRSWWEGLPQERQKDYDDLKVFSSDNENKEYVLRKCRFALELISSLRSEDGRKVIPVGLAIHGELPVVFIQAQGHETKKWESYNELTYASPDRKGERITVYSDVDTTEYGISTSNGGIYKYKLDEAEVERRLSQMS